MSELVVHNEGGRKHRKGDIVKKGVAGVDNTSRRTWDKEEFAAKAALREAQEAKNEESALDAKRRRRLERDPLHQGLIVERAKLKQRDFQIDLTSRVGKTQVITNSTPLSQQAGYYCSVCDCILRDSHSYLDHINGKYHNRALGMSMRVERSTAEQVRQKLEKHREKKYAPEPLDTIPDGFEGQVAADRDREARRERKRDRRRDEEEGDEEEADPELALMLGFSGFGSSKR